MKRAHGEIIVNDDEEQPGTRARISNLIAGFHGVDAAEDDEIGSGDGIPDEWLTLKHMSQKVVTEAKCKEMERFKRMKVYRVVTRESMEKDEEGCDYKQRLETKRGELFAGTPSLMAMRTVISRAMRMARKDSIMLADIKTAFLHGDARRPLYVELPPEDPLSASGRYVENLNVPCMELETLR